MSESQVLNPGRKLVVVWTEYVLHTNAARFFLLFVWRISRNASLHWHEFIRFGFECTTVLAKEDCFFPLSIWLWLCWTSAPPRGEEGAATWWLWALGALGLGLGEPCPPFGRWKGESWSRGRHVREPLSNNFGDKWTTRMLQSTLIVKMVFCLQNN